MNIKTPKTHETVNRIISVGALLLFLMSCATTGLAQDSSKLGFNPAGSYALSDLETIDMTGGNLMMHIPVTALPPGPGGLAAKLTLVYNSKGASTYINYAQDPNSNPKPCIPEVDGGFDPCLSDPGITYVQQTLLGGGGGWRYGFNYSLNLIDRSSQDPNPDFQPQCPDLHAMYTFQVKVNYPDGSSHDLVPYGFIVSPDGYSNVRIDGYTQVCGQLPFMQNRTMTFYSVDGSFARLDVYSDNDTNPWNNSWTLYLADGTRVAHGQQPGTSSFPDCSVECIFDKNNNYIQIQNVNNYKGTGNPATRIVDELGRSIDIENVFTNGNSYDLVHALGANGAPLTWKITWNTVTVSKSYLAVDGNLNTGTYPYVVNFVEGLGEISQIDLPNQSDGGSYYFRYSGPLANPYSTTNQPVWSPAPSCNDQPGTSSGWPPPQSCGWGELNGIILPSGAQANYSYLYDGANGVNDLLHASDIMTNYPTVKQLTYNQEYDGQSTPVTDTWNYALNQTGYMPGGAPIHYSYATAPDGGVTTEYFDVFSDGSKQVYKTVKPDGSMVDKIWFCNNGSGCWVSYQQVNANPTVATEFTTLVDSFGTPVKTATKNYTYDVNGNVTSVAEYDWADFGSVPKMTYQMISPPRTILRLTGNPSGATPLRTTVNTYYNSVSANSANYYQYAGSPSLRGLLASTQVLDSTNTVVGQTNYFYDSVTDNFTNPTPKGNLTQQTVWDSSQGALTNPSSFIRVFHQYDSYGNPVLNIDGLGNQTRSVYGTVTDNNGNQYQNLYPTELDRAYGNSLYQEITTSVVDFYTGLVKSTTDPNGITTNSSYDVFGRPTLVSVGAGVPGFERHTVTEYSDANRRAIVRSDLNSTGDGLQVSILHYDQLGRVRLSRKLENSSDSPYDETKGIKVQTRYLFSGNNSYQVTSNPYRAATSTAASSESTMGWTRQMHDQAGKLVEEQKFGGAGLPSPWGSSAVSTGIVTTAYNVDQVLVTDPAGKQKISQTNGLEELTNVWEITPSDGSTEPLTFPGHSEVVAGYRTSYKYDAFGNLIQVIQGNQSRSFVYGSLKRLLQATNPESGTVSYRYDNNGNLISKTDARGIVSTMTYDPLSRITSKSYSDGTPQISYYYDNQVLPFNPAGFNRGYSQGRLVAVLYGNSGTSSSAGNYYGYDRAGEIVQKVQVSGSDFFTTATYNLAGAMTSETYPSGRTVNYGYDGAGRMLSLSSPALANAPVGVSLGNISYTPNGSLQSESYGNGLVHSIAYNSRLQPTSISLVSGSTGASALQLNYVYTSTTSSHDNNGNILGVTSLIAGNVFEQDFTYDALNRLTYAYEKDNGSITPVWQQAFGYDRYGNRQQYAGGTTAGAPDMMFNQNNQIVGMAYDQAGNMSNDSYHTYALDAENRITGYDNIANQYLYDGEGNRIWKQGKAHIYGIDNKLIEEYRPQSSSGPVGRVWGHSGAVITPAAFTKEYVYGPGGLLANIVLGSNGQYSTEYVTPDHLGSSRVVTDGATGSVVSWHDYQPFGEEISPTAGARINIPQYGGVDNLTERFTAYEKDDETGLYFSNARYYSNQQGRFLSPDPLMQSARAGVSQSWNRYTYVTNNPLVYVDPSGLDWYRKKDCQSECQPEWHDDNPGDAYVKLTDKEMVYYAGEDHGYVVLDPHSRYWVDHYDDMLDAMNLYASMVDHPQNISILASALEMDMMLSPVTGLVRAGVSLGAKEVAELGTDELSKLLLKEGVEEGTVQVSKELAQVTINRITGKAAEEVVAKQLVEEGNEIVASQVAVRTSQGLRYIDHLVKTPEGELLAVEVKSGNAVRSSLQLSKDAEMATSGAKIVSSKVPKELQGTMQVIKTIERRP